MPLLLALTRLAFLSLAPLPACRFEPSCSAYALEALSRYGLLRGSLLALHRLLHCHPLSSEECERGVVRCPRSAALMWRKRGVLPGRLGQ